MRDGKVAKVLLGDFIFSFWLKALNTLELDAKFESVIFIELAYV